VGPRVREYINQDDERLGLAKNSRIFHDTSVSVTSASDDPREQPRSQLVSPREQRPRVKLMTTPNSSS
jgi:hypothetical protein